MQAIKEAENCKNNSNRNKLMGIRMNTNKERERKKFLRDQERQKVENREVYSVVFMCN